MSTIMRRLLTRETVWMVTGSRRPSRNLHAAASALSLTKSCSIYVKHFGALQKQHKIPFCGPYKLQGAAVENVSTRSKVWSLGENMLTNRLSFNFEEADPNYYVYSHLEQTTSHPFDSIHSIVLNPVRSQRLPWDLVAAAWHRKKPNAAYQTSAQRSRWTFSEVWRLGTLNSVIFLKLAWFLMFYPVLICNVIALSFIGNFFTWCKKGLAKRHATQSASVNAFMIHLYWSAGESMTTKFLVSSFDRKKKFDSFFSKFQLIIYIQLISNPGLVLSLCWTQVMNVCGLTFSDVWFLNLCWVPRLV